MLKFISAIAKNSCSFFLAGIKKYLNSNRASCNTDRIFLWGGFGMKEVVKYAAGEIGGYIPGVAGIDGGYFWCHPFKYDREVAGDKQEVTEGVGVVLIFNYESACNRECYMCYNRCGNEVCQVAVKEGQRMVEAPADVYQHP